MHKFFFILAVLGTIGFTACNSTFTPKQTGYPALTLPKKVYLTDAIKGMPYTFDIPSYAVVDTKMTSMGSEQSKTGWMNLQFPSLNATLYISYNAVQKDKLDVLVRDAYNFANNILIRLVLLKTPLLKIQKGFKVYFFIWEGM